MRLGQRRRPNDGEYAVQPQGIAEKAAQADTGWGTAYGRFGSVIEERGLRVGAELGVAFGGHAEALLIGTSIRRLYGVDPYRHFDGYDDPMNLPQAEFDELHAFTLARLSRYGDRYSHMRMTSLEAAATLARPIDFLFVDAVHTCEAVWADLVAWTPVVRAGGVVGGHDYGHVNFPGVQRAVDEFCAQTSWQVQLAGESVWWVVRGELPESFKFGSPPCSEPRPAPGRLGVLVERVQRAISGRSG